MFDQNINHLTEEELDDMGVPPHGLSDEEYAAVQQEMREIRLKQIAEMSPEQWIENYLWGLRFRLRDYFLEGIYLEERSFGAVLSEYLQIIKKTKEQLAEDLGIPLSQINRLINNQEYPDLDLAHKLEKHSGGIIEAMYWWKLHMTRQEYLLKHDEKRREVAMAQVKNEHRLAA